MNVQNIVKEIKKDIEDESKRIKDKILQALSEIEKLKKDFLEIDPALGK